MKVLMKFSMMMVVWMVSIAANAAGGGDGVGNGAGLAEKNIAFAWSNLERYIDVCLRTESCRLDESQRIVLTKIFTALAIERRAEKLIEFKSEKETPGFFQLDGQVRIAKTGSRPGDTIYFNRDLLYNTLPSGKTEGLSVPAATALLIHELGHHQGELDHTSLDLLGAKVQNLLHGYSQVVNTWPYYDNLWASTIRFEKQDVYSQILIWDDLHLLDLSSEVIKMLRCPSMYPGSTPFGAAFHGLRWEPARGATRQGESRMTFKFSSLTYCTKTRSDPSGVQNYEIGEADIEVTVTLKTIISSSSQANELVPEQKVIQVRNHGYGENCRTTDCTLPE